MPPLELPVGAVFDAPPVGVARFITLARYNRPIQFHTSRYQNQDGIISCGAVAVGITRGTPRFRLRYPVTYLRLLAPTRELLGTHDRALFEPAYRAMLETVGVLAVEDALEAVAAQHGQRALVLLCFEDLTESGSWCHRQCFAQWWEDHGKAGYLGELPTSPEAPRQAPCHPLQPPLF